MSQPRHLIIRIRTIARHSEPTQQTKTFISGANAFALCLTNNSLSGDTKTAQGVRDILRLRLITPPKRRPVSDPEDESNIMPGFEFQVPLELTTSIHQGGTE